MTDKDPLIRIKTNAFSRRFQLSRAALQYGARALTQSAREIFVDRDSPASQQHRRENIDYFVHEIGRLKGSVVKVGQIMATYGEYLLPPEVVEALHTMVNDTPPVHWKTMEKALRDQLGEAKLAELEVDPEPVAAASMGQVHRASHRESGEELCIKIQYPGIAKTIDADFDAVIRLLKLARILESTRSVDDWLRDVRDLLHQEADYRYEKEELDYARRHLADDDRFVIPRAYDRYSTDKILTMSWERGLPVNSPEVAALSQQRRNALGRSLLQLFLAEIFDWHAMQTDPNFGNYLVRPGDSGRDQWVLLDFGAMRRFPTSFTEGFRTMIVAACRGDRETFLREAIELGFMKEDFPREVLDDFADIGVDIAEPLRRDSGKVPEQALTGDGEYRWRASRLPGRIGKRAIRASLSRYFVLPPKEFMYAMRKLMGVYAIIAELDGRFWGDREIEPYL